MILPHAMGEGDPAGVEGATASTGAWSRPLHRFAVPLPRERGRIR